MQRKISIDRVNGLSEEEFVARFGSLYEDAPWVAEGAWRARPFDGVPDLIRELRGVVSKAPAERQLGLLRNYPDLAGRAAVAGELSQESTREHAAAGLDALAPEEYEALNRLNGAYRSKFGVPLIFAVREHTKETIISDAEARLGHSRPEEIQFALGEISKIADLRLRDLVEDDVESGRETMSDPGEAAGGEIVLGQNNYGKSEVRVFKVNRDTDRHEVWDLDVRVVLEGDFEAAHLGDDNSKLLATDTMRNTVYALAKDRLTGSIERFGLALVDHFIEAGPTVRSCWVGITQYLWSRIEVDGHPHEHSFVRQRGERRARVSGDESGGRAVEGGIGDVYVLKSTNSGWENFFREKFTTLPDTDDRILATIVTAKWEYNTTDADFDRLWNGVLKTTLRTFTDHYSPSAQHTLYRMGHAVLQEYPEVARIWYSLPNVHHVAYDIERFGIENDGEIFHATHDPYGQIEGWVERA